MRPTPPSLLKLLALPLAHPRGHSPKFLLHPLKSSLASSSRKEQLPKVQLYINKATDKAADLWSGLGKAEKGWKKKAYDTGERLMDKIEYEEWALKAIDPALAPRPIAASLSSKSSPSSPSSSSRKPSADETVELLYPASLLEPEALLASLRKQLHHRAPHHKSAAWRCLVLSPLTWPFAILPIVPNFPLFYVLWRAWSHYRASQASQYLLSILPASSPSSSSTTSTPPQTRAQSPQLLLRPSKELDSLYPSSASSLQGELLLRPGVVPKLVEVFKMQEDEKKELERAVWQSEQRLKQAQANDKSEEQKEKVEQEQEEGKEAAPGEGVMKDELKKVGEVVTGKGEMKK
ncbi:hypothetical protein JCM11641_001816 [Rhodosporidiobolus odoratus]